MAGDFLDTLFNEDFLEASSAISNGKEEQPKGYIFIENEADTEFWQVLFGEDIMLRYEISLASGPDSVDEGHRGKQRFYKNFKFANRLAVFAIDADFAHLTPDRCKEHYFICNNDFIIHTIVYSKENVRYCLPNLNDALRCYKYNKVHSYSFDDYLLTYSRIIYVPLLHYLYSLNKGTEKISEGNFHAKMTPHNSTFISGDWSSLKEAVSLFMEDNNCSSKEDFDEFVESTKVFGLTQDNAFQYINGHHLENRIIKDALEAIGNALSSEILDKLIQSGASKKVVTDKKSEISNHLKNRCSFKTLIDQRNHHLSSEIYALINQQFSVLVS
ncbi:DUF4435 domain-containing protein [Vibrio cholerae]|uniref:DUF4435 domain-containing protein n=1 Tax=Vibrio cholerae TaxID=666 RepID=UPI00115A0FC5|nr:DUF4435 domain-containing protein [Vibrio cholerae]TQP68717.1 DUF4435 domain-containing protein [Vibrio cholerae]